MLRESIRGDYRETLLITKAEYRIRAMAETAFRTIQVSDPARTALAGSRWVAWC